VSKATIEAAAIRGLLVTTSDIARLIGAAQPTVSNWVSRYVDFPEPVIERHQWSVFYWPEVAEWHQKFRAGDAGVTRKMARRAGLEKVA
jgi:hypothetical protein